MRDFEDRLRSALVEGSEEAPAAHGLASASRRTASVRRRRRVTAGAAAAVLAAVVPIAALAVVGDRPADRRPPAADTTNPTPTPARTAAWVTLIEQGVALELPADYAELDTSQCGDDRVPGWGPPGADPCALAAVAVFGGQLYDPWQAPGLATEGTSGYVAVHAEIVQVADVDHETARRILASARPSSAPAPDVRSWETVQLDGGLVVDQPAGAGVQVEVSTGIPNCQVDRTAAQRRDDGRWTVGYCVDRIAQVVGPTQALTDMVAATIRPDVQAEPQTLAEVVVGDAIVAVPSDWVEAPGCTGPGDQPAYGPTGADQACADVPGLFLKARSFRLENDEGRVLCPTPRACVYRVVGDAALLLRGLDRRVLDDVYASARLGQDDGAWVTVTVADVAIDLPSSWRRVECGYGFVVLLPAPDASCRPGAPRVTAKDESITRFPGPVLGDDMGAVVAGSQVIGAEGLPFETVRRILASARPVTEPGPDVDTWRGITLANGVTAVVPSDPAVQVRVYGGIPRCKSVDRPPAENVDGVWTVRLCRNRIVAVTARTQALADVAAAQVEGW